MSMDLRMCTDQNIKRIGERIRAEREAQWCLGQIDWLEFCRAGDAWLESVNAWAEHRSSLRERGYLNDTR